MVAAHAPSRNPAWLTAARWSAVFAVSVLFGAKIDQPGGSPVVHEWGTFTSVAGEDGSPVTWAPLSGPSDLPCFVYRLGGRNIKWAASTVRMETPVLYFYSADPATLSVHVDFPQGVITEWYPAATSVAPATATRTLNGHIEWSAVDVRPAEHPALPIEKSASHYYAARETDSAVIRIGQQTEKLIFYRGMGNFSIPVRPRMAGRDTVEIRNAGEEPIGLIILFANRGGKVGYRVSRDVKGAVTLSLPEPTGDLGHLRQALEENLVAAGLYPKEARAMLETWRDSWFEEGTRVFYTVPRRQVDSVLPLRIIPAPKEIERVYVGRIEVLSPWAEKDIETALTTGDVPLLERYGRFLNPFLSQMVGTWGNRLQSPRATAFLRAAFLRVQRELNSPSCVQ